MNVIALERSYQASQKAHEKNESSYLKIDFGSRSCWMLVYVDGKDNSGNQWRVSGVED